MPAPVRRGAMADARLGFGMMSEFFIIIFKLFFCSLAVPGVAAFSM